MVVWAILSGARSDTQQADVETLMDNGISLSLNIPPCFHFCFYFTNSKINFFALPSCGPEGALFYE